MVETGGGGGSKSGDQIDPSSPLYIHPSDYPRQMQVNEGLTDSNFNDWIQEMSNFLFAKNKIGFVDGTIKKPESTNKDYMAWMRCDAIVKGWLTTAMEKEIRASVKYANTAAEIWEDLKERFGKESAPRAYELKQRLNVTRQDGASVSAYYTKLRRIWDEINVVLPTPRCTCDECKCEIGKKLVESKEKERLYEFLLGLDADFAVIRTQILAMKPTPSLSNAYHMVAEDEQQRTIATGKKTIPEAAAFQANRKETSSSKKPWQKGDKTSTANKVEHCTFCGKDGHNKEGCFKRIGYPDWWPGKKEGPKPKAALAETLPSSVPGLTEEQYGLFLKMLGGINYVKNQRLKLISQRVLGDIITNTDDTPVTVANGVSVPVKGNGEVLLKGGIKIKNALFVPNFKCNLLSVRRLTRDLHCAITFFPDFFVMQGLKTRSLIGAGKCIDGLYRMGVERVERKAMAVTSTTWHKRLGHPSTEKLSHVNFLKNVNFNSNNKGTEHRDKFEPRGRPGVFLGYPCGTKGYRIYDFELRRLVISRHVRFVEEIFPYVDNKLQPEMVKASDEEEHPDWSKGGIPTDDFKDDDSHNDHPSTSNTMHETYMGPQSEQGVNVNSDFDTEPVTEHIDEAQVPVTDHSRPSRIRTQPQRLKDYNVDLLHSIDHADPTHNQATSTVHPLAHYISYKNFSANHKAFLTAIDSFDEPKTFKQAAQDPKWQEAMKIEIHALEQNNTRSLQELPAGKKPIDSKWIYKIKYKPNGEIERYKARLVAKGFTQMEGIDYDPLQS
ncbi:hypothetical protein L1987_54149 [Smallanthus sonchifolius]|uniref:Uncharacterized protein n=1 Tax=Smallanthus sonchifolius TaxID=185202 RepID=A0ACB9E6B8_9ASTR|nr:hypothetical protein L1987_54149 [Smallanthus sonchifolius]